MKKTSWRAILLVSLSLLPTAPLYSQDLPDLKESAFPIVINGDKVQFDQANKTVTGSGNVEITYQDMKLTCEQIVVDIGKKEGYAEGNVTLYQENNVFTAEKVLYDFETKKGQLIHGTMEMEPWYGNADEIDKIDEKLFELKKSYITTCDLEKPHYRIEARTIKVYLNDRVTAWHVFFYVGDAPIMYLPYYNQSLQDNLPQVTLVPGHNSEWGTFLLSSWRYYFHPDSKGQVHFDWRSKRGFGEGVDYKYGLDKFGKGLARFYYIRDREPDESQELGTELPGSRWRAQLRHKWPVDENTFVAAEYNKVSDQAFLKDFFKKEEFELEKQPQTYVTLVGAKENYTMTFLARKKVNDFFTVVERLPEAKLNIRKLKLLRDLNLYYDNETSAALLINKHAQDTGRFETPTDNFHAGRIDSYHALSYPFRLFKFLSVDPFIAARETFYSQDHAGHDNLIRDVFSAGVDIYTKFFKVFDVETDLWGLDIHDIRHLIIPSVKYQFVNTPSIKPRDLFQFDGIDGLDRKNSAEISLQNKLQTKRKWANDGSSETVDMLNFIVKSEYIFRDTLGNINELADIINYDLEITPRKDVFINVEADMHRREKRFETVNAELLIGRNEDERLGLGFLYEIDENSQVTGFAARDFNKDDWKRHWRFEVYERYEIQEQRFQEQEYTIVKDLHCWSGEATVRVENERDYTFWVIFRLKAFPNMPFFFRTTYHGPEPGSKRESTYINPSQT